MFTVQLSGGEIQDLIQALEDARDLERENEYNATLEGDEQFLAQASASVEGYEALQRKFFSLLRGT